MNVKPSKGSKGERRVCEWWDAGDNGEPMVVFEDGSPAPFSAWEHPRSPISIPGVGGAAGIIGWENDYPMSADFNPKHRYWEAGWYPVEGERP